MVEGPGEAGHGKAKQAGLGTFLGFGVAVGRLAWMERLGMGHKRKDAASAGAQWPLCYRCEYRARSRETGEWLRDECGRITAVYSCYAFRPVAPLVLKRVKGDRRPLAGPMMFAARAGSVGAATGDYAATKTCRGTVIYWKPKVLARLGEEG
jgi:hypothetical protein